MDETKGKGRENYLQKEAERKCIGKSMWWGKLFCQCTYVLMNSKDM